MVVGFHRDFDYERLRVASTAVRAGARLLASNDDATYPDAGRADPGRRVDPGRGRAGLRRGRHGGRQAPRARWPTSSGTGWARPASWWGTGPTPTAGLAVAIGWRFALVLSGVTTSAEGLRPPPDLVAADLDGLADLLLG